MEQSSHLEQGIGIAVILIVVGITVALLIIKCILLQMNYAKIPEEHRKMEPGMVWLILIPVFGIVWNFFVCLRLSESYQGYFNSVGRTDVGDCMKNVGLAYCICCVLSVIPCIGILFAIAALVLLIIFLITMFGYRAQIPG